METLNYINDLTIETVVNKGLSDTSTSNPIVFKKAEQEVLDDNQNFKIIVDILEKEFKSIKNRLKNLENKRKGFFIVFFVFLVSTFFLPILVNILTGIKGLGLILLCISILGLILCGICLLIIQLHIRKRKKGEEIS